MTQKQVPSPAGGRHETNNSTQRYPPAPAGVADLDSQSVAGEEDPGASLDMPASSPGSTAPRPPGATNPGDEAPEGTPGTGENICRKCGGSGRVGAAACPSCQGGGKVIVGVGGA